MKHVPIRITSFSGVGYISDPFSYTLALFSNCDGPSIRNYAYLRIGQGMYKQDSSKTYLDIDANARGIFYIFVDPPSGYDTGLLSACMNLGFCFISLLYCYNDNCIYLLTKSIIKI